MPAARRPSPIRAARWLSCLALLAGVAGAGAEPGPLVAVAASLTGAAREIGREWADQGEAGVRLTFGASGNLARQILRGAPFELFVSADAAYPRRLQEAGVTAAAPVTYAFGRLALYLAPGADAGVAPGGADAGERIRALLADPRVERLAIANPRHAPYGRAAREVLEHLALWQHYQGRLVIGESVAQAARFSRSRSVGLALLPLAVVREPELADGRHLVVPAAWHQPIEQQLVLLRGHGPEAGRFARYLLGERARAILEGRGYTLPAKD